MARPLRVEVEGGWYHVISRGIDRRAIFADDLDRRDFLERLFGLRESHGILVHGYCLMENHFHVQVETLAANLNAAMQRLLSGYVVRFNIRHRRVGPLFQGRYRAILANEPEWRTEVNRYIHLNPVSIEALRLGKQRQAQVRRGIADEVSKEIVLERLKLLREYPWSSYRAYAGYAKGAAGLHQDEMLNCFEGETQRERRRAFRKYTEQAIREGLEGDNFLERVRYGVLLGSDEWMDKMRALLSGDSREQKELKKANREQIGFSEVTAAVEREFGERWEQLVHKRGHPGRDLLILLCRQHTGLKLKDIGDYCRGMDYAAVSQAHHRMKQRVQQTPSLAAIVNRVSAELNVKY